MCRPTCCISAVLYALSALFTLVLGLLLGSAFPAVFLGFQTALIVAAVILFVVIAVITLRGYCRCSNDD